MVMNDKSTCSVSALVDFPIMCFNPEHSQMVSYNNLKPSSFASSSVELIVPITHIWDMILVFSERLSTNDELCSLPAVILSLLNYVSSYIAVLLTGGLLVMLTILPSTSCCACCGNPAPFILMPNIGWNECSECLIFSQFTTINLSHRSS